jgi:hypothetical protein
MPHWSSRLGGADSSRKVCYLRNFFLSVKVSLTQHPARITQFMYKQNKPITNFIPFFSTTRQ